VVAGGGLLGLSTAWYAGRRGYHVVVCEPAAPGEVSSPSWVAAGRLAPVTEVSYGEPELLRANLESRAAFPGFVADLEAATGADVGYRECGNLIVARSADDAATLGDLLAFQRDCGLEASWLRSKEARRLEPALATTVRGAIHAPGDAVVDPRALLAALEAACDRAGVERSAERVTDVEPHPLGDGVTVTTDACRRDAATVVVAAGVESAGIRGAPPELGRIRPVKGQLCHLRPWGGYGSGPSMAVSGPSCYAVPRGDGELAVGATVEEVGADRSITVDGLSQLLRGVTELLPGTGDYAVTETLAGLRPTAPDNAPMVGPTSVPGVAAATGHYRHGVLLLPSSAEALGTWLDTGALPPSFEPFDPRRFAAGERGER